MSFSGGLFFLFMALVAGIAMALQGAINSALGKIIGLWETTFLVHLSASIVLVIMLFLLHTGKGDFNNFSKAPWYLYMGGLIGVLITYGVVISIPKLGAAVATTAIIVGQVLTAMAVDHFGLFGLKQVPFSWIKLAGLVLLATGAKLLLN
ncbi:MAG: bacterial/archaeal transporter family-2 protein [Thermosediminibacterales bacterium]|nr:bacterial/archaeal transporter family-2 protein [Thermosediminibacterales bacterium]MDK2836130.1 bacterial/archaeal transporter family-2 protein [Thermosediminibacterales bacterium]